MTTAFNFDNRFQLPDLARLSKFRTLDEFNANSSTGFAPNTHFSNTFDTSQLPAGNSATFAGSPINSTEKLPAFNPGFQDGSGNFFDPNLGNGVKPEGFNGLGYANLGLGILKTGSGILDALTRRKNLKLARDAFNFQKEAFNKNFGLAQSSFDNQVTTVNNRINDQNAFKTAQGRTDLAKLVL